MKQLMLLFAIRKHFPAGHQWQSTQMRGVHLLGLHSQSALPGAGHGSDSSPRDSALMCMHLCHIIQALLRLTPTWHLNSPTDQLVMPWRRAPLQLNSSRLLFRQDCPLDAGWVRRAVGWCRAAFVHAINRPVRLLSVHQHHSGLCLLIWWIQRKETMAASSMVAFKMVK